MMPAVEVDAAVRLTASVDGLAAVMLRQERDRQDMAAAISYIDAPAFPLAGSSLPLLLPHRPRVGYSWAVQRMTVSGLGTSDYLTVYKGRSVSDAVASNALHSFTVSTASAAADWEPGRTSLILRGADAGGLVFGGSSFNALTVSWDAVQIADAQLAWFLL